MKGREPEAIWERVEAWGLGLGPGLMGRLVPMGMVVAVVVVAEGRSWDLVARRDAGEALRGLDLAGWVED